MQQVRWPYRMQEGSQQILARALAANPKKLKRRIGYGGPKGGGKSYGARGLAFTLTYQMPIVVTIVRSRLKVLQRNHIIPAKNELRHYMEAKILEYNDTHKMFTWKHESGGIVQFAHAERESDVDQFDGIPSDLYIFEESGHFTELMIKGIWKNCRSTDLAINRGAKYPPRVLCTFNWGGRGHQFNRRVFWDRIFDKGERPDDYLFIFAKMSENKALMKADPNYDATLKELPPALMQAYLLGDPDAFVGVMFTIIDGIHEIDPEPVLAPYNGRFPDHWQILGSLDAAAGGGTCSFGLYALTPEGKKYKFYNYYETNKNPQQHVDAISAILTDPNAPFYKWTKGRKPEYIVTDSFAIQNLDRVGIHNSNYTFKGLFEKKGYWLYPVKWARVPAIMALQTALHFETRDSMDRLDTELEVEPDLQFFRGTCKPTLDELRSIERDKTNPEDNAHGPDDKDDAIDETKNLIMTAENPPPKSEIPQLIGVGDYNRSRENTLEAINYDSSLDLMMGSQDIDSLF